MAITGSKRPVKVPVVEKNKGLFHESSPLISNTKVVLEEYMFERQGDSADIETAINALTGIDFGKKLVVLFDDDFDNFVQYATEITPRIGLDYEKKTVKEGALFYEEFLPPETIMYSLVLTNGKKIKVGEEEKDALAHFSEKTPNISSLAATRQ